MNHSFMIMTTDTHYTDQSYTNLKRTHIDKHTFTTLS